jgi:hypothetical protein
MLSGHTPICFLFTDPDATYVYGDPLGGYVPIEDTKTDSPDALEEALAKKERTRYEIVSRRLQSADRGFLHGQTAGSRITEVADRNAGVVLKIRKIYW